MEMTKGQRTRQAIVAQAAAVFNQKGFNGCSMAEMCELTRVQKGGLYRHFASKEELALEAFDYAARLAQEARQVTDEERARLTPLEQLDRMLELFVNPRLPLVPGGCPIFNAAAEADDGEMPALRARVEAALERWLSRIAELVQAGIESGQIRPTIEPRAVAMRIVSALEGALMIGRVQRSREAVRQAADELSRWLAEEVAQASASTQRPSTSSGRPSA